MKQLRRALAKCWDESMDNVSMTKVVSFFPDEVGNEQAHVIRDYTTQVLNKLRKNVEVKRWWLPTTTACIFMVCVLFDRRSLNKLCWRTMHASF